MAQETRTALVEAAVELFSKQGYGSVTLRDVARRARLSTGAVYSQFGDKADLLVAALHSRTGRPLAAVERLNGSAALLVDALTVGRKDKKVRRAVDGELLNLAAVIADEQACSLAEARSEVACMLGRAIALVLRD
jgi:AcrR family transcriptional regulator